MGKGMGRGAFFAGIADLPLSFNSLSAILSPS